MKISLKCQYAIRGVLELARRHGQGAVPISEIVKVYEISTRFLEVILNELKRGGFVGARRGVQGGFFLAVHPRKVTVGDIVRFVDGPLEPVSCVVGRDRSKCPQRENCPLPDVWGQARQAVEKVYDAATFEDLVKRTKSASTPNYCI
jgi:Rrf2 family transcriptional regulator, cysteine metabolism repressor